MHSAVDSRIRSLPDRPGIYVFRDGEGKPLYVGKAKSLRKRGTSYLRELPDPRLRVMAEEARELDYLVTDTEAEALLLENNWIKSHRPRYNVLLRDDKTYPYVKLTLQEKYPRVVFTRRVGRDGAAYFGPFLPGGLARRAIKLAQKLFGVRVCRIPIDGKLPRPCLYYDMGRCLGPCVAGLTSREAYAEAVEQTRLFLSGRHEELAGRLRREMGEAAEALEFERAAALRDTLREVQETVGRQKLASVAGEDVDVFGHHLAGGNGAVVILVMRGGHVLDRRELFWEGEGEVAPERLFAELLPQLYEHTPFIPKEVHLPVPLEDAALLEEWLGEKKGERVYLRFPSRGAKAQRVQLATRNAQLAFRRRFRGQRPEDAALESLQGQLELADRPRRIEALDVSHFQGGETVASLVVWEEGRLRKGEYRTFNIRGREAPDDFAAMAQAVSRRYARVLEETGVLPDLILVDGGRGQLNAALGALAELGVEETPVAGLAKREEELYLPARPLPLALPKSDPGLKLLQQLRDEAHRFAVSRHRRRRSKRLLTSRLDELPGIGPRRRKLLLQRFGSVAGVRAAPLPELQEALGPLTGARVHQLLHTTDD